MTSSLPRAAAAPNLLRALVASMLLFGAISITSAYVQNPDLVTAAALFRQGKFVDAPRDSGERERGRGWTTHSETGKHRRLAQAARTEPTVYRVHERSLNEISPTFWPAPIS